MHLLEFSLEGTSNALGFTLYLYVYFLGIKPMMTMIASIMLDQLHCTTQNSLFNLRPHLILLILCILDTKLKLI